MTDGAPPTRLASLAGTTFALGCFVCGALVLTPVHLLLRSYPRTAPWTPRLFHHLICRALRVEVRRRGLPAEGAPILYVANHVSWLDIFVLGGELPAAFVAKSEVKHWPLVGWLARLQPTLFVERDDLRGARAQARALAEILRRHGRVILFAEGTSTDGTHVQPFKSALFEGLAEVPGLRIQPLSLAYSALSGTPVSDANRDRVAWYADMRLPPHLFGLAGERSITVDLDYSPAFPASDEPSRKAMGRRAEAAVRAGHQRLIATADAFSR